VHVLGTFLKRYDNGAKPFAKFTPSSALIKLRQLLHKL
jgi:hypothetical protein